MNFSHYPVLLKETLKYLNIKPDGVYLDATFGGGGHSGEILKLLNKGKVIGIDQDEDAIKNAEEKFSEEIKAGRLILLKGNFINAVEMLRNWGEYEIDGAIMDLGVSSYQIDTKEKGFSYIQDAPLDMRMNRDAELTAKFVVNSLTGKELKEILYSYGEEKYSDLIVRNILAYREKKDIETTGELTEIILEAVKKVRYDGGHPSKKTFQALRIYVNNELNVIEPSIRSIAEIMKTGARLNIITFHSLEDRIVKKTFADMEKDCECPPSFPICICNKKQIFKCIVKKPVLPSEEELRENSRSRSAKLRVAEKIE